VLEKLFQNKTQTILLLIIFLFYLLNGTGALDIHLRNGPNLNFNGQVITALLAHIINEPVSSVSLSFLMMIFTGLLLSFLLPVVTPMIAAIMNFLLILPHLYLYITVKQVQTILPMEYSLLIILVLFSMNALLIYFVETHSKTKIIQAFGQFVPSEIINKTSKHPDQVNMNGESRIMTVFFCDLQDFSNVAEQLNPKQLSLLLNEYFDAMTEILFRYGGTIDKYIGDSIMAFCGAPIAQQDHAQNAVLASLDMIQMIAELSDGFIKKGWPGPKMGVGINTG
jgi:adenylate cyclase